jgi:hypothetical protein
VPHVRLRTHLRRLTESLTYRSPSGSAPAGAR